MVVQDVIAEDVEVALGLISKNRMLQEAKLLVTDVLRGGLCCDLGLLHENARFDVWEYDESVNDDFKGRLHVLDPRNGLVESHNWDHSLCFIFEVMLSESS